MQSKICYSCKRHIPLDDFYNHPMGKAGKMHICKACHRARVVSHRRENDSVREYDRKRAKTKERRDHSRQVTIAWRKENPDRYRAQTMVGNYLRDGKIKKADKCSKCGDVGRLHAHHHDYSKPLDVIWMCARCHAITHAEEKRI